jgi:hypothetical protein
MNKLGFRVSTLGALLVLVASCLSQATRKIAPDQRLVTKGETAIKLARILIESKYGKEMLSKYEPLRVTDMEEEWVVRGFGNGRTAVGGVTVAINALNCKTHILLSK